MAAGVADSLVGPRATWSPTSPFRPDVLDLAGIDADSAVPGNQSFRWVAKATLTGTAQLGYFVSGDMTIVRASTDADAAPEVEIQLTDAEDPHRGRFPAMRRGGAGRQPTDLSLQANIIRGNCRRDPLSDWGGLRLALPFVRLRTARPRDGTTIEALGLIANCLAEIWDRR